MRNTCIYEYIYIYNDRRTCYTYIKYMITRAIKYLDYYYIIRIVINQHNKYVRT